jgi:Family of unknown function (DUF6069)
METTQQGRVGAVAPGTRKGGVGAVALVAMTAASLVWTIADVAGLDLEVHSGSGTSQVTLVPVIVTPMLATILAVSLLRLLERRTTRALRTWTIVATTVWPCPSSGLCRRPDPPPGSCWEGCTWSSVP